MRVAVVGCTHGALDAVYATIAELDEREQRSANNGGGGVGADQPPKAVELVLCCGDFQSLRNEADLSCMASKYPAMGSFHKYYSGAAVAPILTIVIGGNHEASNYLQELPYGGWLAPNIYYLGYAGVVRYRGLRIAGLSGIYKAYNFRRGHFERAPYDNDTMRSVYHTRSIEVFRMKGLTGRVDVCMSHDWPVNVALHGDWQTLCKQKLNFREQIETDALGSPPLASLMDVIRPTHWFAAHMHIKYTAIVPHPAREAAGTAASVTKFLALDQCLPGLEFLQILDLETNAGDEEPSSSDQQEGDHQQLCYDLEWLTILRATDHLMSFSKDIKLWPTDMRVKRATDADREQVRQMMGGDLAVSAKQTFCQTARVHEAPPEDGVEFVPAAVVPPPKAVANPQTTAFCKALGIIDPVARLMRHI